MDSASATLIYKLFYIILHCIFTIYETLQNLYFTLYCKLHRDLAPCITPKITKIPKHLTLLLGGEDPSYKDLANLILWCMAFNVTFLSIYDHKGTLKKHQDKLKRAVRERKGASDHVIWHDGPDSPHTNGYVGRKIHVKVLSREDGKGALAEHLRGHGDGVLDIEGLDSGLRRRFEFPDPDLGLCCGKTLCLKGYPPWQIRVTEFLLVRSHRDFTFENFVQLLHRFNKCEQRFGK